MKTVCLQNHTPAHLPKTLPYSSGFTQQDDALCDNRKTAQERLKEHDKEPNLLIQPLNSPDFKPKDKAYVGGTTLQPKRQTANIPQ